MEVRIATKADIASLVALRLEYLRADYSVLPKEVEQVLRAQLPLYFSRHLGKDCHVYLAEEHQSAVSCAFLIVLEQPANPHWKSGNGDECLYPPGIPPPGLCLRPFGTAHFRCPKDGPLPLGA